jgi:predicted TIM-barrel enzyme
VFTLQEPIRVFACDIDGCLAAVDHAPYDLPLLVGSGVTPETVAGILDLADGVIVASALKAGGVWWNPVEGARVRRFMEHLS